MPNRFGSPGKRQAQSENCVLDVSMCDFTGPVLVSLWGDFASEFLNKVASVQLPVVMRLTTIRASKLANNDWNGQCLTSIHVLHSVQGFSDRVGFSGTEMSFPAKPESPHMFSKPFVAPSMPVCMQSFRQLLPKAAAPFRASFHGFVVEVGQLDMTANGHPKRFRVS